MAIKGRDTDQLINVRTLAKMLKVSRQAIHYRCKKGSLPHINLAGNYLFNERQVNFAVNGIEWKSRKKKSPQQELIK